MGYNKTFFKANRANKGAFLNISTGFLNRNTNKPDYSLFLKLVKQVSWNEKTLTGSFKGGDEVITKLTDVEAASLVRAFRTGTAIEKGFYHKSQGGSTQINLRLVKVQMVDKSGEKVAKPQYHQASKIEQDGHDYFYTLSIYKDSVEFKIFLNLEEVELFRIFLETSLAEFFNYEKRFSEKQANRKPVSSEERYESRSNAPSEYKLKQPSINETFKGESVLDVDDDDIPF